MFNLNLLLILIGMVLLIGGIVFTVWIQKKDKEDPDRHRKLSIEVDTGLSVGTLKKIGLIVAIVGVVLLIPTIMYRQDPGEVCVIRNFGGSLAGSTDEAGLHLKNPLQSIVRYDVRSNTISFIGQSGEDYVGGQALGPQITINDASGTTADMDVQIQYSLDPSVAEELYTRYGTQENFVKQVVAVGSRTRARDVAGRIDTIKILTSRGDFSMALKEALSADWEDDGVIVENVSVQEIRYPQAIKDRYADAQAAEIAKEIAKNEQEVATIEAETKRRVAEVEAETKLIQAEGEANANETLQRSLTDDILTIRYMEALKDIGAKGNLIVVPEGATPFVNVSK